MQIAVLHPTKPSSDDDSVFKHGFRAEAWLLPTQSIPAVHHEITYFCWFVFSLWECHIHVDAVKALFGLFLFFFFFFNIFPLDWYQKLEISQICRGWLGNETSASGLDRKQIYYPAICYTLFKQMYIFFNLRRCVQSIFS